MAGAGHRHLEERLSRTPGRAINSLTSARDPREGPGDGDRPPHHQDSPFSPASDDSFSPSQDPSVTQLTNAPQGGLAEFNPFSEVGGHALFLSPWVLWVLLASLGKETWQRQRSSVPQRDRPNVNSGGWGTEEEPIHSPLRIHDLGPSWKRRAGQCWDGLDPGFRVRPHIAQNLRLVGHEAAEAGPGQAQRERPSQARVHHSLDGGSVPT